MHVGLSEQVISQTSAVSQLPGVELTTKL